ncbi:MAG: tRNA uridine-5-carboxymethylaminomethyl(34) synthesis GTPase MnmE [Prevotella sp.]|nr:tRNA uridine-5-carboxymethylaminomethyl(34) synthesis GTPase MnmE [Prevotella sp.]
MGKEEMSNTDTICALATAPSGALSIIRVSGTESYSAVLHILKDKPTAFLPNTVHYHQVVNVDGEMIDEVMVSSFRAPHSYTGEDSIEIACHGSTYIIRQILNLLVSNGCRMANPGEYTMRAYLNGKIDLSQAEAVADLIASTNRATHQMAMSQLRGVFSSELSTLREQLLKLTSLLELELDFSDHEDLEFADRKELMELAQTIESRIKSLAHSFETGQAIKQGIPVAIVGKTNVGKSTLLNRLLKDDRAIVSEIHGTTRDTIEDTIDINGITFRFIDTAGIRQTQDTIEQIGINRTYQAIEKASIILWLIDNNPSLEELREIQGHCEGKSLIIIQNKIDKEKTIHLSHIDLFSPPFITISAKYDTNIDALEKMIYQAANIPEIKENDIIVTNARHYEALMQAQGNIQRVIEGLSIELSGDLIAEDLRLVLSDLSEITGEGQITPQETLNNIFSHFCVGK